MSWSVYTVGTYLGGIEEGVQGGWYLPGCIGRSSTLRRVVRVFPSKKKRRLCAELPGLSLKREGRLCAELPGLSIKERRELCAESLRPKGIKSGRHL